MENVIINKYNQNLGKARGDRISASKQTFFIINENPETLINVIGGNLNKKFWVILPNGEKERLSSYLLKSPAITDEILLGILQVFGLKHLRTEAHNLVDLVFILSTLSMMINYSQDELAFISSLSHDQLVTLVSRIVPIQTNDVKYSYLLYGLLFAHLQQISTSFKYIPRYHECYTQNRLNMYDLLYTTSGDFNLNFKGSTVRTHVFRSALHYGGVYSYLAYYVNTNPTMYYLSTVNTATIDNIIDTYGVDFPVSFNPTYIMKLHYLYQTIRNYGKVFTRPEGLAPPPYPIQPNDDLRLYTLVELITSYNVRSYKQPNINRLNIAWFGYNDLIKTLKSTTL